MAESKARDKAEIKEKADQYKVLFDFYKAEYEALRNEFYKVEDKAAKYLTSLSVLSGILLVSFKGVVSDFQPTFLSLAQVFILCVLIASLSTSWRFIFMVLKPVDLKTFPYTQDGIDYFDKVDLDVFYYSMSIEYVGIISTYKIAISEKTESLKKAFSEIKLSGLVLLLFLSLIFVSNVFCS